MAFDGITIAALTVELSKKFIGASIKKIAQPESDELMLTFSTFCAENRKTLRLKLSANASLPLIYLCSENKPSPLSAPNFCMLLRKHLSGSKVEGVYQEGFERVIRIRFSGKNELGDDVTYFLVTEIMGKHSNIIFLDENDHIIDSIKHVNSLMSSVREVLPGRDYFIPNTMNKLSPFDVSTEIWNNVLFKKPETCAKAIASSMTGISMIMAHELCHGSGIDGDAPIASLNGNERSDLMNSFRKMISMIETGQFDPVIYYDGDAPKEFSATELTMYNELRCDHFSSISEVIEKFYLEKETLTRIKHKSSALYDSVRIHHERIAKKLGILEKQLLDTEKKDRFKVYGELINTYGYTALPPLPLTGHPDPEEDEQRNINKLKCINYYDGSEVEIPIDPTLSVSENANRYFDKYNKLKRTYEAVSVQLSEARDEFEHLESILNELEIARKEEDLTAIRTELINCGYIKKQTDKRDKKQLPKSEPLHFISSDGYDIYVGKNNYQNEELTFKLASASDWWFHAKQIPGSHVILKSKKDEPPIHSFEEAAALAALFSKGKNNEKLEIDYTIKKNVKKPGGGRPGFVVYYTNYSMVASKEHLKRITPGGSEEEAYL